MEGWVEWLWLIPALPLGAAAVSALLPRVCRRTAAGLAIASLAVALGLSVGAFVETLAWEPGARQVCNVRWLEFAAGEAGVLWLGWVLDPLSAAMLVMVSGVGLLIFVYSLGYMAHDENFTRFFCFLSLFAAAMLGLVMANSLVGLFICWELVGLTSYLLIGFWYRKPAAAAAAKKAFITTRVGDMAFLLGLVWWFGSTGTQLFFDGGRGCLEATALQQVTRETALWGLTANTAIGLLLFAGAVGKSGQLPLHVWLPDAMEGPTPVSALIHAATMVAAGVFLMARVYPLWGEPAGEGISAVAHVVAWVGALTAVFAAAVAVAQDDIKRILAYSTISQLGYMMLGLATGGVAVGMFHLLTHACFKALLFLGAGSVIHGCAEEQNIWRMGGLGRRMPLTFVTYAVGMLALAGFPLVFSGFWSKEEILHAAHGWRGSEGPFWLALTGVCLTAFYMTRQVVLVFAGERFRGSGREAEGSAEPHESPPILTAPLLALAALSVGAGFVGTPAWPWLQGYLEGRAVAVDWGRLFSGEFWGLAAVSGALVMLGMGLGGWLYGRRQVREALRDPLERLPAAVWPALRNKLWVDELYERTVVAGLARVSNWCDRMDRWVWGGIVQAVALMTAAVALLGRRTDEVVVNGAFDQVCEGLRRQGRGLSAWQNGRVHRYLGTLAGAFVVLVWWLVWGGGSR
ncbi:NADH-quinone oxidoreductase subunit L [Limisphaera sp. VF-2]|jgi:NADH-quinone oxidoreductase subunit L|uniref:NADH-quinone oxidoreductase subunit L n=1 Tax=Limisphaera sp. VF-2 TaxID=3400418 RepID=UPI001751165F